MTAFVAGATGYTGREVVRSLVSRGIHTVAHVRPDSPSLERWQERFQAMGAEVDTTAWDELPLADRLAELAPSLVFCLIGTTRHRGREAARRGQEETYDTVDYGLTALLARAAARARGARRFVYLSSLGASPLSANPYLRARGRAERAVMDSGMPWTIVRPSFITGPDREEPRPLERLAASLADTALDVAGRLGGRRLAERYHSIDASHLAQVLVRLGTEPGAARRIYEPPYLHPLPPEA